MKILAIETSFDETACAIIEDGTKIISNVLASSHEMHKKYGGVVPEIAARKQLECIIPVITETITKASSYYTSIDSYNGKTNTLHAPSSDHLHIHPHNQIDVNTLILHSTKVLPSLWLKNWIERKIDAIAVTVGPGLIGSLLVGVETAKTIAFVTGKPIVPVNHVLAHMYANFIRDERNNNQQLTIEQFNNRTIEFPAISLVVSGGHTELYLMKSARDLTWLGGTLDDAAGECFDKTARLLGFGHGGGVAIEREAHKFSIQHSAFSITLPRPMINDKSFNFSFSGLKTAVMREWKKQLDPVRTNFAFEIQEAITDVLVEKTLRAAKTYGAKSILLSGGVAANLRLREKFSIHHSSFNIHVPDGALCTDNAVFIASYAYFRGKSTDWHSVDAIPDLSVEV